jgi:hypothetical protein
MYQNGANSSMGVVIRITCIGPEMCNQIAPAIVVADTIKSLGDLGGKKIH